MASKAAPLMAFMLMLSGCARFEVGLEQTATLDQRALTTISALGTENAQLATQVAALATPTPAILEQSTPTATASGLSAARIRISYVEGGDLWLLDGLRLPVQLTDDGSVERARMALRVTSPAVVHDDFWAANQFDAMDRELPEVAERIRQEMLARRREHLEKTGEDA